MNAQLQPATLNDNELRATIYFAVGVASEGSNRGRNVAYELAFAGYIHREGDTARGQPREAGVYREGQLEPIYNSGYSIGTLQTDFGQQRNDANRNADQDEHANGDADLHADEHTHEYADAHPDADGDEHAHPDADAHLDAEPEPRLLRLRRRHQQYGYEPDLQHHHAEQRHQQHRCPRWYRYERLRRPRNG